jgi:hypothetical protein
VSNANVTGVNFTATAQTYSISGTISGTGGAGASVVLSGASSSSATADGSGNYSFSGLGNGSYTVTPSKAGYTFSPTSQSVTVSSANVTGVNFTATAQTYSISGTISGAGGAGASVVLSGAASSSATADTSGNYTFSGLASGSYAVTPSHAGYNFTPTTQAVTVSSANVTGVNFTASVAPVTYTLSGSISPASVGAGAVVTLSGAGSGTTTADSSGNYSFTSLGNGSYTVTPSSTTATFSPTSQSVTINNANVTGVNFTGTATSNVVFFDDFNGTSLDTTQWVAMNRHGDYSNGELQCYLPGNVSVAGGMMVEEFLAQTTTCGDSTHAASQWSYTSGMVQWKTFNFTYGTVEVRAKVPNTTLWPAIWMLGANCQASNVSSADNVGACNWPVSGSDEIDIAEFAPNDASARENSYSNSSQSGSSTNSFSCGSGPQVGGDGNFHVYTFTWTASRMSWAVDGQTNCTTTTSAYIPTKPMFIIINIAANSSASPGGLPQSLSVDYVKVTQP